jgi:excisionase family DNA binding protein
MDKLMMVKEAAEYTGTSPDYLRNQAKQGHLAYVQTSPKKILYRKIDLDEWMKTWRIVAPV